jgi:hypothetical protein
MKSQHHHNIALVATTSLYIAFALVVAFSTIGCDMNPSSGITTPPAQKMQLELTYVSGHLGNYWDCPGKSASGGKPGSTTDPSSAPAADMAGAMRACDPDDADCDGIGFMNCEEATILMVVKNVGKIMAKGIEISDLELLDADKKNIAKLEIVSTSRTDDHELTGTLAPNEEMQLLITFQGPNSNDVGWNFMGHLHIIVVTDDDSSADLVTSALEILPAMAT